MREQEAKGKRAVGAAAERGDRGHQRLDQWLEAALILERLGERRVSLRVARVLRDQTTRGAFRRHAVSGRPLGLGQQIERPLIGRANGQRLAQDVARAQGARSGARIEQRFGHPLAVLKAAGRVLERLFVRGRRVRPPAVAPVEIPERRVELRVVGGGLLEPRNPLGAPPGRRVRLGQQRRTVLPAGLLLGQVRENRDRLVVRLGRDIEPRQHRAQIGVGRRHGRLDRLLQVLDRLAHVVALRGTAGARRVGRPGRLCRRSSQ